MTTALLIVHILVAIGIIALVLLQQGKGADMGAAFGAGSSGSVFGATGSASFLSRVTAGLATVFFLSSLGLTYFSSHEQKTGSVMSQVKVHPKPTPAKPADHVPNANEINSNSVPKAKEIPN